MNDTKPDYFAEGRSYYEEGYPMSACPYPEDAPNNARVEWEGGWMEAEEMDEEEL